MQTICLVISIVAFLLSLLYSIRKMDIFNPIFLYTMPMVVQYWIYITVYGDINLHSTTYIVILFNFIFYFFGYFFADIIIGKRFIERRKIYVNNSCYNIFVVISIVGFFLGIIEMYRTGTGGEKNFFTNVRINEVYGSGKSFFTKYSTVLLFIVTMVYLYNFLMDKKKLDRRNKRKRKIRLTILCSFLILSTFFTMARTELLTYVLAIVCLIYAFKTDEKRGCIAFIKKYRLLFVLVFLMIVAFAGLGQITTRATDMNPGSKDFYLYRYCGYTLVTFDKYYVNIPSENSIILLLGPLEKIISLAGIHLPYTQIVPLDEPYNVAGYYCTIYATSGILGIVVVNFILGFFVSWLYNKSRKQGGYSLIFYSTYIYAIMMSFFAYQYANTLYLYIIFLIIILKVDGYLRYHR